MVPRGNNFSAPNCKARERAKSCDLRRIKFGYFLLPAQLGYQRFQLPGIVNPPSERGAGSTHHRTGCEEQQGHSTISIESKFTPPEVGSEPTEQIPNLMLLQVK